MRGVVVDRRVLTGLLARARISPHLRSFSSSSGSGGGGRGSGGGGGAGRGRGHGAPPHIPPVTGSGHGNLIPQPIGAQPQSGGLGRAPQVPSPATKVFADAPQNAAFNRHDPVQRDPHLDPQIRDESYYRGPYQNEWLASGGPRIARESNNARRFENEPNVSVDPRMADQRQYVDPRTVGRGQFVDRRMVNQGRYQNDPDVSVGQRMLDHRQFGDPRMGALGQRQFVDPRLSDVSNDQRMLGQRQFVDPRMPDVSNDQRILGQRQFVDPRMPNLSVEQRTLGQRPFADPRMPDCSFDQRMLGQSQYVDPRMPDVSIDQRMLGQSQNFDPRVPDASVNQRQLDQRQFVDPRMVDHRQFVDARMVDQRRTVHPRMPDVSVDQRMLDPRQFADLRTVDPREFSDPIMADQRQFEYKRYSYGDPRLANEGYYRREHQNEREGYYRREHQNERNHRTGNQEYYDGHYQNEQYPPANVRISREEYYNRLYQPSFDPRPPREESYRGPYHPSFDPRMTREEYYGGPYQNERYPYVDPRTADEHYYGRQYQREPPPQFDPRRTNEDFYDRRYERREWDPYVDPGKPHQEHLQPRQEYLSHQQFSRMEREQIAGVQRQPASLGLGHDQNQRIGRDRGDYPTDKYVESGKGGRGEKDPSASYGWGQGPLGSSGSRHVRVPGLILENLQQPNVLPHVGSGRGGTSSFPHDRGSMTEPLTKLMPGRFEDMQADPNFGGSSRHSQDDMQSHVIGSMTEPLMKPVPGRFEDIQANPNFGGANRYAQVDLRSQLPPPTFRGQQQYPSANFTPEVRQAESLGAFAKISPTARKPEHAAESATLSLKPPKPASVEAEPGAEVPGSILGIASHSPPSRFPQKPSGSSHLASGIGRGSATLEPLKSTIGITPKVESIKSPIGITPKFEPLKGITGITPKVEPLKSTTSITSKELEPPSIQPVLKQVDSDTASVSEIASLPQQRSGAEFVSPKGVVRESLKSKIDITSKDTESPSIHSIIEQVDSESLGNTASFAEFESLPEERISKAEFPPSESIELEPLKCTLSITSQEMESRSFQPVLKQMDVESSMGTARFSEITSPSETEFLPLEKVTPGLSSHRLELHGIVTKSGFGRGKPVDKATQVRSALKLGELLRPSGVRITDVASDTPISDLACSDDALIGMGRGKVPSAAQPTTAQQELKPPPHLQLSREEAAERALSILEEGIEKSMAEEQRERRRKKFSRPDFSGPSSRAPVASQTESSTTSKRSKVGKIRPERQREKAVKTLEETVEDDSLEEELTPEQQEVMNVIENTEDMIKSSLHGQFLVDFEPEYLMEEFGKNPDLEDKPFPSLEETLERVKHLLMPMEGLTEEKDWQDAVQKVLAKAPQLEKLVEAYSGPARVSVKQQNRELEAIAGGLPAYTAPEMKAFTERALITLQNNPSWNLHQKKSMLNRIVSNFAAI